MIRTIAMLTFWGLAAPVAALIGFPWTFISGDISLLYRMFMWGAWNGVRLTGVRVETIGSRPTGSCANLYLHVESRFESRSTDSDSSYSAAHIGDGEERIVQLSDSGQGHAHGIAGARGSRQSRRRH